MRRYWRTVKFVARLRLNLLILLFSKPNSIKTGIYKNFAYPNLILFRLFTHGDTRTHVLWAVLSEGMSSHGDVRLHVRSGHRKEPIYMKKYPIKFVFRVQRQRDKIESWECLVKIILHTVCK